MVTSFDEKGKIFTQVVRKQPTLVTLQTATSRISGLLHVHPDCRLMDELEREEQFVALTDASVMDLAGTTVVLRTAFITVNKQQIIWVLPNEDLIEESRP